MLIILMILLCKHLICYLSIKTVEDFNLDKFNSYILYTHSGNKSLKKCALCVSVAHSQIITASFYVAHIITDQP